MLKKYIRKVYMKKIELKFTHHAISYKMKLHLAELERNSSFLLFLLGLLVSD